MLASRGIFGLLFALWACAPPVPEAQPAPLSPPSMSAPSPSALAAPVVTAAIVPPSPIVDPVVVEVSLAMDPVAEGSKTGARAVFVVAPAIALKERVAEIRPPYWCRARAGPQSMSVSCTPDFAHDVATLLRADGPLILRIQRDRGLEIKKEIALPPSATLRFAPTELDARASTLEPCPKSIAPRRLELRLDIRHTKGRDGHEEADIGIAPPIVPARMTLLDVVGYFHCKSQIADDAASLSVDCASDDSSPGVGISVDGDTLFISTVQWAAPLEGRVSLPCGAKVRFHGAEVNSAN